MARYGELFLKSEPVKHHFIGMLLRNIRKALGASGITCRYETPRGRILIYGDEPERIAAIVSRIFGIVDVSICCRTSSETCGPEPMCSRARIPQPLGRHEFCRPRKTPAQDRAHQPGTRDGDRVIYL